MTVSTLVFVSFACIYESVVTVLVSRAPDDVTSPVPNTHGLGVRRPADTNPSPPLAKRKHRAIGSKEGQASGKCFYCYFYYVFILLLFYCWSLSVEK